jgi:predicted ester cyclase
MPIPPSPEFVVRTWFEDLWNKGIEGTIERFLDREGVINGLPTPDGKPIHGPADFKPFYRRFRGAFPDIHVDVRHLLSDGELVVAHCHVTGTHRGVDIGVPPTGERVDFEGFAMARVVNGLIVESWNAFDFLTMYQQVGVSLAMPAAS